MAYVKPQLVCQDQAVSYQAINIIQNSLDANWLAFTLRHGAIETTNVGLGLLVRPPPSTRYGQHNDVRIPRATVAITGSRLSTGINASWGFQNSEPGIVGPAQRVEVGVVEMEVGLSEFYAEAWPKASGGVSGPARIVVPVSIFPGQNAKSVLRFELYEEQGGVMTPTEYDFWAHIYGTP